MGDFLLREKSSTPGSFFPLLCVLEWTKHKAAYWHIFLQQFFWHDTHYDERVMQEIWWQFESKYLIVSRISIVVNCSTLPRLHLLTTWDVHNFDISVVFVWNKNVKINIKFVKITPPTFFGNQNYWNHDNLWSFPWTNDHVPLLRAKTA